jgi:hypothetical protein
MTLSHAGEDLQRSVNLEPNGHISYVGLATSEPESSRQGFRASWASLAATWIVIMEAIVANGAG